MTTTVLPPALSTPAPAQPRRRRHPRAVRVLAVIGLAILAVAAAAAVWLVGYYQPLTTSGGGSFGAGVNAGGDTDPVAMDNAYGTDYRFIEPKAGAELAFTFPLWNQGRLGVTVVSVGQPFNPTGVVDEFHVQETSGGRATRATDFTEQKWVAASNFAMAPGDYAQLRVVFRVLDCATVVGAPGGLGYVMTVPVTIRVLGAERVVNVELPYALSIDSLPHCPYPAD